MITRFLQETVAAEPLVLFQQLEADIIAVRQTLRGQVHPRLVHAVRGHHDRTRTALESVPDSRVIKRLRDQRLPFFESDRPLWRLSLPPATPRLTCEQHVLTAWAGAQRWVYSSCSAAEIREEVAKVGGHAILFRHGDGKTPVFHPLDSVRTRLHRGLKQKFDPRGILNPGRQYASI